MDATHSIRGLRRSPRHRPRTTRLLRSHAGLPPTNVKPMQRIRTLGLALIVLTLAAAFPAGAQETARVRVTTSLGAFVIELDTARAPLTSANFLEYVKGGHYDGTVFHRVIANFVAQAGGYDSKYVE